MNYLAHLHRNFVFWGKPKSVGRHRRQPASTSHRLGAKPGQWLVCELVARAEHEKASTGWKLSSDGKYLITEATVFIPGSSGHSREYVLTVAPPGGLINVPTYADLIGDGWYLIGAMKDE